jgi:hypothetical protein
MQIGLRLGWPPGRLYRALLRSGRLTSSLDADQQQLALQLYARDGMSIDQLLQFLTCTRPALLDLLKAHHVPARPPPSRRRLSPDQQKRLVAELSLGELTWKQLAAKYHVTPPTMVYAARMERVRLRGFEHRSRRARLKRQSHAEELAERDRQRDRRAMRRLVIPHKQHMAESRLEYDIQEYSQWRTWWAEGQTSGWIAAQLGLPAPRVRKMMSYLRQRHDWFPRRQTR